MINKKTIIKAILIFGLAVAIIGLATKIYRLELNKKELHNPSYLSVLPEGFTLYDVNNDKGKSISYDFDKDGVLDLAVVLTAKEYNNAILALYLSSSFIKDKSYQKCEWMHMINDFKITDDVLELFSIDMGRYTSELVIKYDCLTKSFKVVSYKADDEKRPLLKLENAKL